MWDQIDDHESEDTDKGKKYFNIIHHRVVNYDIVFKNNGISFNQLSTFWDVSNCTQHQPCKFLISNIRVALNSLEFTAADCL